MDLDALVPLIIALLLTLPRLAGLAIFVPYFKSSLVPPIARNGILLSLGVVVMPVVFEQISIEMPNGLSLVFLIVKELLIGSLIGFLVGLVFLIPQSIGDFIDNQRGASIASIFNPLAGEQASILGTLLTHAFMVWFLLEGGLVTFLGAVFNSYHFWPVTGFIPEFTPEGLAAFLQFFSNFIHAVSLLAAPIIFIMLLTEISLGLVGRFAQQLNVFFLAMPLKSISAIFVLIIYFRFLMNLLIEYSEKAHPFEILTFF